MYLKTLNDLRSRINVEAPVVPTSNSLIPQRGREEEKIDNDPLSLPRQWLERIKTSSNEFREKQARNQQQVESITRATERSSPTLIERRVDTTEAEWPEKTPQAERRSIYTGEGSLVSEPGSGGRVRDVDIGNARTLVDLIDATEAGGGYDTLFGYSNRNGRRFAGVDVSRMTIGEIKEFSRPNGEYGQWVKQELARSGQRARVATPMGRYQFVGATLRRVADEMGLSNDTVFNQETQDAMFNHYARSVIRGKTTLQEKITALRGAWEGLNKVPTDKLATIIRRL